jgi:predicted Rossmann-fold nucleotide-binding protein
MRCTASDILEAGSVIGRLLADHKCTVVFGGGSRGLMGTVAQAALDRSGKVVGVTTKVR